jgi:hypothetical protein
MIGRATKLAAQTMLGKVYLYQEKWNEAKTKLEEAVNTAVTSSKGFESDINKIFSYNFENGRESIFEIQCQQGLISDQAGVYYDDGGGSGLNNWRTVLMGGKRLFDNYQEVIACRDLFNEFEQDDIRLRNTFFLRGLDLVDYYEQGVLQREKTFIASFRLDKNRDANFLINGSFFLVKKGINGDLTRNPGFSWDYGDNIVVIRYSDLILMLAEAQAESGDLASAKNTLNSLRTVRNRPEFPYTVKFGGHTTVPGIGNAVKFAGIDVTYNDNLDDFRKALVHERRVELAFEYHRFNDIRRWDKIPNHPGSAFKVFDEKKSRPVQQTSPDDHKTFRNANLLFPIPQAEIDKSNNVYKQNPQ